LVRTATPLRALMAIMGITPTLVHLMATTDPTGSRVACSLAQAPGSTVSADEADSSAAQASADLALVDAADSSAAEASLIGAVSLIGEALLAAVQPCTDRWAAASEAALAVSTVEAASMAAVPTGVDTDNCAESKTENRSGWQHPLPAVFVFRALESGNSVS
jgi:hypothetical protein